MSTVVHHALAWVGTPFVHGVSARGQGADCLGLILGIWRDLGLPPIKVPPYGPYWFAKGTGSAELFGLRTHFQAALSHWAVGDIVAFRLKPSAAIQHLGVLTAVGQGPRFVHAMPRSGVVEVSLSAPWQRRIALRARFPELAPGGCSDHSEANTDKVTLSNRGLE